MQMPYVSEKLFEEIKLTAKMVSEIAGYDVECEGLLLSDYGGNVCRYTVLPRQDVGLAKCICYGLHDIFKEAYSKNQRVMGVWHSHGGFDVFHSGDDDRHLERTILPLVKEYNNLFRKEWKVQEESNGIRITSSTGSYLVKLKPENEGEISKVCSMIGSIEENLENKVLSLVVNSKDENYYAELYDGSSENDNLNFVEDRRKIDGGKIVEDIGEKIRLNGVFLKYFPNYENVLEEHKEKFRNKLMKERLSRIVEIDELADMKKILAGKYEVEGKRVWKWEDRMEYFNQEYHGLKNKEGLHKEIKEVERIVEGNKYLNRHHKGKAAKIKKRICELKHRSLFRILRRKRYEKNKAKKAKRPQACCNA